MNTITQIFQNASIYFGNQIKLRKCGKLLKTDEKAHIMSIYKAKTREVFPWERP